MSNVNFPELHANALDEARKWIAGIPDDKWHSTTPCTDWDVRYLVNHIVGENLWVPDMVAGKTIAEVGDQFDGDVLGDDPLHAYNESSKLAADAFREPGAMNKHIQVSYGPVPGSVYCAHRFLDVVVHGWDIAKATGQDTTIKLEFVSALLAEVKPQAAELEASGYFGKRIKVPADADPQTHLLALIGRSA